MLTSLVYCTIRVLIFAALGLLCTLCTTWPISLSLLYFGVEQHHYATTLPWTSRNGTPCATKISLQIFSDAVSIAPIRPEQSYIPRGDPARVPYWAASPDGPHPDASASVYQVDTGATGWPFRALASESWIVIPQISLSGSKEDIAYAIVIASTPRGRVFMPLRPIWPGLVADIVTHGLAFFLLARLTRTTRAAIRRRRGVCPRCAYDLRGSAPNQPCPECGVGESQ